LVRVVSDGKEVEIMEPKRPFVDELIAVSDRVTAAAVAAGVTVASRTPRIRMAEERFEELLRAYEMNGPPVLRDDVEEALRALERELMAEVQRAERRQPKPGPSAFDELFEGVG
jgi:hypothetical protein